MEEPYLIKYLKKVHDSSECFSAFEITYVPREQKSGANILSKLANTKVSCHNRTFDQEALYGLNIEAKGTNTLEISRTTSWMMPIIHYLLLHKLSSDEMEVEKI